MVTVINNCDIFYTKGDTFRLFITSSDDDTIYVLRFQVARNAGADIIIDKTVQPNNEVYTVELNEEEKQSLDIGDYVYRVSLIDQTDVITQKSGNITVKWGV